MEHYIKDRVIVITGGTSGFGLETARLLLEMGGKVVITGRNQDRIFEAVKDLASDNLLALQADATSTPEWKKVISETLDRFCKIDVLVNNHGAGCKIAEVENMSDEDIYMVLDINLASIIKGAREVVRVMKGQRSGHIINVSSACAHHSWPQWAVYTAAKAGMVGYTRCLHLEMAAWGGKATTFIPGAARTGFCDAAGIDSGWQVGYPGAVEFARTLVHCIDVPQNTFIEEVSVWGTQQVKDMLNPF